jgi:arylsulfatase A-like enzyme
MQINVDQVGGQNLVAADKIVDGRDLVAEINAPTSRVPIHDTLVWRVAYKEDWSGRYVSRNPPRFAAAVQRGSFKYVRIDDETTAGVDTEELYNLEEDEAETTNLKNSNPTKVNELRIIYNEWKSQMEPQNYFLKP